MAFIYIEVIQIAKEIDQISKLCGFNQSALDQVALQGYGNLQFEVDGEERLELFEKLYFLYKIEFRNYITLFYHKVVLMRQDMSLF